MVERVLRESGHEALFLAESRPHLPGSHGRLWNRVTLGRLSGVADRARARNHASAACGTGSAAGGSRLGMTVHPGLQVPPPAIEI